MLLNDLMNPETLQVYIDSLFVEGDERLEDGGIRCGKCGGMKTCHGTGVLEGILLPIRCECKKRADDERLSAIREAEEERRREELRRIGLTSKAYAEKTFAADVAPESSVSKTCRRYCEQWSEMKKMNAGLLLYGDVGTGKSFYACCIANEIIDRYFEQAYVTTIPRLISQLQPFDGHEKVAAIIDAVPLLVLDDLGAERETSFVDEQLFSIIDRRLLSRKPTIVTTNLTLQDIRNPQTTAQRRIYDRIIEMCPIQMRFDGRNWRADALISKREQAFDALR
jgi:DNA replication protein DnaC